MPGALGDVLDAIQTGLSQLPPVAYVVGLLFGPTAAYIGYRLYTAPKTSEPEREVEDLYWICTECRSANEVRDHRCYLCATDRDAVPGALHVIDHDQLLVIEEAPGDPDPLDEPFGPMPVAEPAPAPVIVAPVPALTLVPVMDVDPKPVARRPRTARVARPPVAVPIEPEDDAVAATPTVSAKRPRPSRAKRPPVAVPIEPEDDVLAASHTVSAAPGSDGGR